ncbi:MAG: DUF2232 domain-containing protein [Hyphomicrobiaceae bacterium]
MLKSIVIGVGAGLVSALLLLSIATGTGIGLTLGLLAAVPSLIAGLGWGVPAASAAALVAAGIPLLVGSLPPALVHLIAVGVPAVAFSHYALLWREAGPDGTREWYPLGRIVTAAAVWAGVIGAIVLLQIKAQLGASDVADMVDKLKVPMQAWMKRFEGMLAEPMKAGDIENLARVSVLMLPGMFATVWLGFIAVNAYVAGRVTALSGQLERPWPDLSELRLPRLMPVAFMVSVLLAYVGGIPGLIASGFVSAFTFAYVLVGLAIIHNVTRGLVIRPMLLAAVYSALIFLGLIASPVLALIGLAEPFSPLRRKPPPAGQGGGAPGPD